MRHLQLRSRHPEDSEELLAKPLDAAIAPRCVRQREVMWDAQSLSDEAQSLVLKMGWTIRYQTGRHTERSRPINDGTGGVFGRGIRDNEKLAVIRMIVTQHENVLLAGGRHGNRDVIEL